MRLGQRIHVDDGTCPAGQVKEVSGAKMTSDGRGRGARKCVPRLGTQDQVNPNTRRRPIDRREAAIATQPAFPARARPWLQWYDREWRPKSQRLEHALKRRLCNLRECWADRCLFRPRHPIGLDGRHTGLANAAQHGFAKVAVLDGCSGIIMQATAHRFGMRPAPHAMCGCTKPHELRRADRASLSATGPGPAPNR